MGAEGTNFGNVLHVSPERNKFHLHVYNNQFSHFGAEPVPMEVESPYIAHISQFLQVGTYPALLSDELGAENLEVTYPLSQVTPDVVHEFQLCG